MRMDEPKIGGYAGVPAVVLQTFTSITRTNHFKAISEVSGGGLTFGE